jgi:hypothetical protein
MWNVAALLRTAFALSCDVCGIGGQTVSWYSIDKARQPLCARCAAMLAAERDVRTTFYPMPPPG